MNILIGQPFKEPYPVLKHSRDRGVRLKNRLFVRLSDLLKGCKQLQPFKTYNFSGYGKYKGYSFNQEDNNIALFELENMYQIFLFDDLFDKNAKPICQISNSRKHQNVHIIERRDFIAIFLNGAYVIPKLPGNLVLFDKMRQKCFVLSLPYNGNLCRIYRENSNYILWTRSRKETWIYEKFCLNECGHLLHLDRRFNLPQIHRRNRIEDSVIKWKSDELQHLLSSKKIDATLDIQICGEYKGMRFLNIELGFPDYEIKSYGICIPNGQMRELPNILQPILEGNPVENHLGKALNDHFHEYIR